MNVREQLAEQFDEQLLFLDGEGFDACIIGVVEGWGPEQSVVHRVVYDREKLLQALMQAAGVDEEDALDYFEFNILGSYVGPQTPVFLSRAPGVTT